jgi:hypothetical protein
MSAVTIKSVHDSQVTQIEKTERVRLDKPQKI